MKPTSASDSHAALTLSLPPMLLIVCALAMGACSNSSSATDPSPSASTPPVQAVASEVSGLVFNTLFRPVAGASIEISHGSGPVVSLLTDQDGWFEISGSFRLPITVRASKAGFRSETGTVDQACCNGKASVVLDLGFDGQTVRVQPGNYTLTFIADSGCREIPEELRVRTFAATITPRSSAPTNARYIINVSGPTVGTQQIALGVFGNRLAIADGDDTGFSIFEALPSFRYVSLGGGGSGETTGDESIVTSLSLRHGGDVNYCALNTEMPRFRSCYNVPNELVTARGKCNSDRHRIVLEPR